MRSLRIRILLPLITAVGVAVLAVAWISQTVGKRLAMQEMQTRYEGIRRTLDTASFPLTKPVLELLSQLTETHWITLAKDGRWVDSTLMKNASDLGLEPLQLADSDGDKPISIWLPGSENRFYAYQIPIRPGIGDRNNVISAIVLFDKMAVDQRARTAATFPLWTGLLTVAIVAMVMLAISSRLIGRIRRLEADVQRVAEGQFDIRPADTTNDELGRLAERVGHMGSQLQRLWKEVDRQQGSKLLHQVSAGMAHQLRNTLTGAKLALQLHQDHASEISDEVSVALKQIRIAEDYVTRLLTVGSDPQGTPKPMRLEDAFTDVRSTHESIAKHLGVKTEWKIGSDFQQRQISDGAAFIAALSNLVLNAMDVADQVAVSVSLRADQCVVSVRDNGPGVDALVQDDIFQPFVTSKPEGMGLGLAVVARSVESLGGKSCWHRENDETVFEFTADTQVVKNGELADSTSTTPEAS